MDFCNTIVIMTSNVGAEMIKRGTSLGFVMPHDETADARRDYEEMRKKLLEELGAHLTPDELSAAKALAEKRELESTLEELLDLLDQ